MNSAHDAALQRMLDRPLRAIRLDWNEQFAMLRVGFRVHPIQCFSLTALNELLAVFNDLSANPGVVRILVLASDVPRVFNFGGDLSLFVLLARARDLDSLTMYGRFCIEILWWLETADERDVATIGLVQGDCLGGGLELVLPLHRVVCERDAKIGFPEVLFNLFPGMGAWSFIARKSGLAVASEMILSGRLYSADELHARGLVDLVVDECEGEAAVQQMVRAIEPRRRGMLAALRARRVAAPITHTSLIQIVDQWAEAVMKLTDRDLRLMERLARAQIRKVGGADAGAVEEIKRIELENAKQSEQRTTAMRA